MFAKLVDAHLDDSLVYRSLVLHQSLLKCADFVDNTYKGCCARW